MANNQVTVTVDLSAGYTFNVTNPGITFNLDGAPRASTFVRQVDQSIAIASVPIASVPIAPPITPGIHSFSIIIPVANVTGPAPPPGGSLIIGTVTYSVNSLPVRTGSNQIDYFEFFGSFSITSSDVNIFVACLHGSSMIQIKDGTKRLDQIKEGDEVLSHSYSGQQEYTQVKGIAQCWLSFMGVDHDAIIFEPNSLGTNEPDQQLIIDPGHPMCTQNEFLEKGPDALRPAATYWEEFKGDKVYTKKWTDVFVEDEPSVRYDLILEEPFNTYVTNGIVVRSKGYKDHRYKEFV